MRERFLNAGGMVMLSGVAAFVIYALLAGELLLQPSIAPYYVHLADAFGHGQLHIENPPNWGYDMIHYSGKWYVAQQPLPALIAMPFVALLGVEGTSDVLIGVLGGSVSVALCAVVLRHLQRGLHPARWLIGVVLFAFGTVHVSLSVMGTVWYLGQITAAMCLWAFILCVMRQRPLLAGLFAGLACLSRSSLILACIVFAIGWWYLDEAALNNEVPAPQKSPLRNFILRFCLALLPAIILLGVYNLLRFNNPFDFGYDYIAESAFALQRREMYGNFHPIFLLENAYVAFVKPLGFAPGCLWSSRCGIFQTDLQGAGLLWTSPAVLAYGIAALRSPSTQRDRYRYGLIALSAGVALLPALLYHNTGEAQFGYRFALDALPFWMLLVVAGTRRGRLWLLLLLVGVSVIVNIWGAKWLMNVLVYGR